LYAEIAESTVAATIIFYLIELINAAVSTIRETFLSIFNIHDLNDNTYYGVMFDSAVINASNTLSRMQAYVTFL
jgi:hypothetical protein